MAHDVLDHNDSVVDKDADREDQSKQCDPVQGVTVQVEHCEREGERDRYCQKYDAGLPPAQGKCNQQCDRQGCDQKVFEKFVGFVLRGLAIVARNRDVQIIWKHIPAQSVDFVQHTFRNVGSVRTFALGKCDGHCGTFRARGLPCAAESVGKQDVGVCFGGAVLKLLRYVTQIYGTSSVNPDHDLTQVVETREKSSSFDLKLAIVARKTAGLATAVRVLELPYDRARCKAVGRETLCVEHDSYLPRLPTDDLGLRDIVERLERIFQLTRDSPQAI